MKALLFCWIVLNSWPVFSQEFEYQNPNDNQSYIIKIKSKFYDDKKTFTLKKGRKIWIRTADSLGHFAFVKARIINIRNHEVDLGIKGNHTISLPDSLFSYVEFTSMGRVLIAGLVDTFLVSTAITGHAAIIGLVTLQVMVIVLSPILIFVVPDLYRGSNYGLFDFAWVGECFRSVSSLYHHLIPFKKKISVPLENWTLTTEPIASK